MSYNGWKNYQTWNVALWIQNDEGLYDMAKQASTYAELIGNLRGQLGMVETPDGVAFNDSGLDVEALDEMWTATPTAEMCTASIALRKSVKTSKALHKLLALLELMIQSFRIQRRVHNQSFFGESDTEQVCADCHQYLYGEDPEEEEQ